MKTKSKRWKSTQDRMEKRVVKQERHNNKSSGKSKLNTDSTNYTSTGSSNNSNNDVDNNTLQQPDKNVNKMIDINVDYVGDNSGEIGATQQQKCGQSTPIAANLTPSKIRQFSINDINKNKR